MKTTKTLRAAIFMIIICLTACTKNEDLEIDFIGESEFLKFNTTTNKNQSGPVLYSEWIPSGFPNSSLSGAEFFDLPLIKKDFYDIDKDIIIFYGKRNSVSQLPVTIPVSSESYMVELFPATNVTIPRIRVTSLHWATEALQDIFFRPSLKAAFRVVIIPGEKLLSFKSNDSTDFEKMTYEEIAAYFELSK